MRIEMDGHIFEGKPEEIAEMFKLMGAEFPVKGEAEDAVPTENRLAKVGERILVTNAEVAMGAYANGDVYTVESLHYAGINILEKEDAPFLFHHEYEVIVGEEVAQATKPTKPKVGDIVVITANTNASRNTVGDIGKISDKNGVLMRSVSVVVPGKGGVGDQNYTRYEDMRLATPAEIKRYEDAVEALKAPKFAIGDYARALADSEDGDIKAGAIVVVDALDRGGRGDPYDIGATEIGGDFCYFRPQDLEILEGKALVFAKAGRKPNEFRKGDIVRVNNAALTGHKTGDISEVVELGFVGLIDVRVLHDTDTGGWVYAEDVELIAPVEARVDRADV